MLSFEQSPEELNFSGIELEHYFYELEFAYPEERYPIVLEIAKRIPWRNRAVDVVDRINDPTLRMIVRNLLPSIHEEQVNYHLGQIAEKGNTSNYNDLEKGVFLLSSMGDMYADYKEFKASLDKLAYRLSELFLLNKEILSDDVKIHLLCRVLYEEEGFTGNQIFYHNPENSYLTKLMKNKLGIPISLSVVYILVGMRLGMPIYGINLPLHFMLYFEAPTYSTYVDPFNGGVLLDRNTCIKFLEANGYKEAPEFFQKASTLTILKRMYNNLINVYKKTGPENMEMILLKQLSILENKSNKTY